MGHYYDEKGEPNHYQVTASGPNKGKKRSTTIRDAKKKKLFPSVSEVCSQLESNGLTRWQINQALTHGHEIASKYNFPEQTDEFVSRANLMLKEESEGYADFGTMVHEAIEQYILSVISGDDRSFSTEELSYIDRWNDVVSTNFPDLVYLGTEVSFGNKALGYGGCIDVIAFDRLLNSFVIPDLKTKKTSKGKSYYVSEKYPLQLTAYRDGFDRFEKLDFSKCPEAKKLLEGVEYGFPADNTVLCNIFLSSTEDDRQEILNISTIESQKAAKTFDLLRQLYFLRKDYDPTQTSI